jgi:hypothetical protein
MNTAPITLPSNNPFSTLDTTVSYSSKVDLQMESTASQFRSEEYIDWDDEFNTENDYE